MVTRFLRVNCSLSCVQLIRIDGSTWSPPLPLPPSLMPPREENFRDGIFENDDNDDDELTRWNLEDDVVRFSSSMSSFCSSSDSSIAISSSLLIAFVVVVVVDDEGKSSLEFSSTLDKTCSLSMLVTVGLFDVVVVCCFSWDSFVSSSSVMIFLLKGI